MCMALFQALSVCTYTEVFVLPCQITEAFIQGHNSFSGGIHSRESLKRSCYMPIQGNADTSWVALYRNEQAQVVQLKRFCASGEHAL